MPPHHIPGIGPAIDTAVSTFHRYAELVHTERWQGVDIKTKPEMATWEVLDYSLRANLFGHEDLPHYRSIIGPSLPWADDHFAERVCGRPFNPGEQWRHWPWAQSARNFLDDDGIFSHTYMERYWCRHAGVAKEFDDIRGIRHRYGDLNDLVILLANEPQTRQAYFPVWFPEDTGAHNTTRKPCSLGYWFTVRDNQLHTTYYIRSCDLLRHFRDDIYLTIRLILWILLTIRSGSKPDSPWQTVKPGTFTMHIGSLHCFRNDWMPLFGEHR